MGTVRRLGKGAGSDFGIDTVVNSSKALITASAPGPAAAFVLTAGIEHNRSVSAPALLITTSIRPGAALGQQATTNARMGDSQAGCGSIMCFPGLKSARAGDGRDWPCGLRSQIIGAQALGAAIIRDDFDTGHVVGAVGLSGSV